MKIFYSVITFFCIISNSEAQNGCASSLSNSLITGPDSTYTDGDQTFRSLTVNPYNANHVMIGSEGNGVFSSRDGGISWTWDRNGLKHWYSSEYPETWGLAFDLSDTNVIFMAGTNSPGPITGQYPSAMAGVYKSTDGGKNWVQKNCGLNNSKIATVWCDSNNVVISVSGEAPSFQNPPQNYYSGGLFYSTDKGENWVKANAPIQADSSQCWRIIERNGTLFTASMSFENHHCTGFMKSVDKGKNWTHLPNPLSNRKIADYGISADGMKIIAVVRDSFFVYISENQGQTWSKLNIPLNGLMHIHPLAKDTLFMGDWGNLKKSVVGLPTGDINSVHYKQVLNQDKYIEKMVIAPSNPNIIYIATRDYRIYKSTDGGESFNLLTRLRDVMRKQSQATNIEDLYANEVQLYPNPSEGKITFGDNIYGNLKIFDATSGKLVYNDLSFSGNQLDLSELNNGVYILELNNIKIQKVVICR